MWHGIRRSPLRFVYRDYDDISSTQGLNAARLPLDPVTPDNVACIRNPAQGFEFGRTAWRVISDPFYFYQNVIRSMKDIDPDVKRTIADYREHVRLLEKWGMLELVDFVFIAGRYFAVAKRAEIAINDKARTIYDGRYLNGLCFRPPPVNIPDPVEVSKFIATIKPSRLCIYLADFRHFFHQFGLHPEIRTFFGLAIDDSFYQWTTLPMGFSWAPFVAQATAMALIAEATQNFHARDYSLDTGIPHYIETKKGSRIYLTYDNLAIVGGCKREVQQLKDAIMRRLRGKANADDKEEKEDQNSSNVRVKEEFMCHGMSLRADLNNVSGENSHANQCCHIGVQYGIANNRTWVRVTPKTAKRWANDFASFDRSAATKRDLARICGIVLHANRIRHRALYELPALLTAMRSLYPIHSWDVPAEISDELFELFQQALDNSWVPLAPHEKKPIDCVVASDASGTGVGYIIHDAALDKVVATLSAPELFPKHNDPHQAIFVKELIAALAALQKAKAMGFRNPLLLTDNSAGAAALINGFSTNEEANKIVRVVHAELSFDQLLVRAIPGISNPADEPSRGKDVVAEKTEILRHLAKYPDAAPILRSKCPDSSSRKFTEDLDELRDDIVLEALAHLDVSTERYNDGSAGES